MSHLQYAPDRFSVYHGPKDAARPLFLWANDDLGLQGEAAIDEEVA